MTERKRSKKSNVFVWGIMGFLILGMGGFGLSGAFLSSGGTAVASVGDEEVSVDLYFQALRQDVAQASQNFGFQLSLEQAQAFGIDQLTLRRLMNIAAIDNETRKLNLSVGDSAVLAELLRNPAFLATNGEFDSAAYEFALQQIGMTPDEYDAVVRNALAQTLIRDGVAGLGNANGTAVETIMAYIAEIRDFNWVLIDADSLPEAAAEPTDTELRAYYAANPELFTQPETRSLTYIALTPAMLALEIDVAETEIIAEYDARSIQYNIEKAVFADRLVFATMAEAEAAKAAIDDQSATFDSTALERGVNPTDLSLGFVTEYGLSVDAADVLFETFAPGIYGPLESEIGPALFRVNAVRAASTTPLEDVRDEIRDAIALVAAGNIVVNAYDDINDLIAGGAILEDVAADTDMKLFQINYDPATAQGIASQSVFATEALAAELDEERDILGTENGGMFVLRVDAINESYVQEFNEVKDRVIAGRLAERNQELVEEYAATLMELIESGADFGPTMLINGLSTTTENAVTRNSPSPATPPEVTLGVFEMENGGIAVFPDVEGAYLVQLINVAPYDPENPATAALYDQIEEQVTGSVESDIFAFYSEAIIGEVGFTVNQPLLQAIIDQNGSGGAPHVNDGHGGH